MVLICLEILGNHDVRWSAKFGLWKGVMIELGESFWLTHRSMVGEISFLFWRRPSVCAWNYAETRYFRAHKLCGRGLNYARQTSLIKIAAFWRLLCSRLEIIDYSNGVLHELGTLSVGQRDRESRGNEESQTIFELGTSQMAVNDRRFRQVTRKTVDVVILFWRYSGLGPLPQKASSEQCTIFFTFFIWYIQWIRHTARTIVRKWNITGWTVSKASAENGLFLLWLLLLLLFWHSRVSLSTSPPAPLLFIGCHATIRFCCWGSKNGRIRSINQEYSQKMKKTTKKWWNTINFLGLLLFLLLLFWSLLLFWCLRVSKSYPLLFIGCHATILFCWAGARSDSWKIYRILFIIVQILAHVLEHARKGEVWRVRTVLFLVRVMNSLPFQAHKFDTIRDSMLYVLFPEHFEFGIVDPTSLMLLMHNHNEWSVSLNSSWSLAG